MEVRSRPEPLRHLPILRLIGRADDNNRNLSADPPPPDPLEKLGPSMPRKVEIQKHDIRARNLTRLDLVNQVKSLSAVTLDRHVYVQTALLQRVADEKSIGATILREKHTQSSACAVRMGALLLGE